MKTVLLSDGVLSDSLSVPSDSVLLDSRLNSLVQRKKIKETFMYVRTIMTIRIYQQREFTKKGCRHPDINMLYLFLSVSFQILC